LLCLCASPALAAAAPEQIAPLGNQTVHQTVVVTARQARSIPPQSPDVFNTVALDAGVTAYGARWRRVSAADLSDPRLKQIGAAAAALDPVAKLGLIHSEVRRRIAWRSDLDTYRVSDYWAQAGETLNRGHGDGEDIAILEMQALKAAGFHSRDIYLSVGRDSVRGADTLLLVRVDDRFYVLDDRAERPVLWQDHRRFAPIITLGKDSAWLHGKRFAGRAARAGRGSSRVIVTRLPLAR